MTFNEFFWAVCAGAIIAAAAWVIVFAAAWAWEKLIWNPTRHPRADRLDRRAAAALLPEGDPNVTV